jgi:hypothetical protein
MSDERDGIERGIAELTRHRAQRAPEFEALLDRPARQRHRRRYVLGWVGAAAALVLGLSLWLVSRDREAERHVMMARLEAVSEWRAPTDVFLPPLDRRWLSESPPLGATDLTIYTGTDP